MPLGLWKVANSLYNAHYATLLYPRCELCLLIGFQDEDGWNISIIDGVSVTCNCRVSLDHPSPAMLAPLTSLSFHFIPIESILDKKDGHHTRVTGLLLHTTQRVQGQYYRVGLLDTYLYGPNSQVIISHLERRDSLGATCYLDTEPDDLCAIEII